ncbi:MAG: phosphotransferase family protein [Acidimicrobiales bacterium]
MAEGQTVQGIDADNVTAWFVEHAPTVAPPLTFELITGGHSNLTFRVTDSAGTRWVLRRPPLKQVLATAHDMGREARILTALAPTPVPVPPVVGLCTDEDVNGAPFYVMEFVDGRVVRNLQEADALTVEQRRRAGESIVDVLAEIHAVDIDAAGLGDFAKREDYIARQLKRWYGQFEKSKTREIPVMEEVHTLLAERIPEQGPAAIVHGDYRLRQLHAGRGRLARAAVLDWEICTLGDPLADVGLLMVYWGDRDAEGAASLPTPTTAVGFPPRPRSSSATPPTRARDLSHVAYYEAFGYWKLACIIEGVYARYKGGAMGTRDEGSFDFFGEQVVALAEIAREAVNRA